MFLETILDCLAHELFNRYFSCMEMDDFVFTCGKYLLIEYVNYKWHIIEVILTTFDFNMT